MKRFVWNVLLLSCLMLLLACDGQTTSTKLFVPPEISVPNSDVVAPVLMGEESYSFAAGLPLDLSASALGISATDDVDGDITSSIVYTGEIDLDEPGSYPLVYTVVDSAGNIGTKHVTILLVDHTFQYAVDKDSVSQYFKITLDQTIGGNNSMIYKVTVEVKGGYAIHETVRIRLNVDTVLGYRQAGSIYFQNHTRSEFVVIDLQQGDAFVSHEYTVRITAVEVQARPYEIEIVGASGQVKTK